MNSKLTINLTTGQLEVEGSDEFVKEIYKDFKEMILKGGSNPTFIPTASTKRNEVANEKESNSSPKTKASAGGKSKPTKELKMLTDLNLRPDSKTSLKDFAAKYDMKTAEELTLVIVYYLKEELKETVTVNHIFTCYNELDKKIPQYFKQTLSNCKNNKNWIDVDNWNDIKYTVPGMNHMKHDIKKAVKNVK